MVDAVHPIAPAVRESAGFRLEAPPAGHILQILARRLRADLAGRLAAIAEPAPFAVRRAGPQHWFIVGDAKLGAAEVARRGAEIADFADIVDQTHGRRRLVLSGAHSAARLARGVGADLSPLAFPVGAALETQYDDIGLHLTRTAPDGFELLVGRSLVESLWRELER